MAEFKPRTFSEIFGEMVATLVANSPITDINIGSVGTTLLEAAAQEDDEQYFQMRNIILNYSLDTTSGDDLDSRAFDFGLTRKSASKASTKVTISDSSVTKISTGVFSGLPGASSGDSEIEGDSAAGFSVSGSVIIGRNTLNVETIAYTSITQNVNSVTFNLGATLVNDHGTDETIIFSQGGDRIISAGIVVKVPSSDLNEEVLYTVDNGATIVDGESQVTLVPVTASIAGASGNVPIGYIVEFDSNPFSTAVVTNPDRVTNGSDIESDQELRDRVRETIQSLSRGTAKSIVSALVGTVSDDDNKRIVSSSIVEPNTVPDIVKLYIDDGTGFIPSFQNVGIETVVTLATGGETFLTADNPPIVKAFVETTSITAYNLSGTETLIVEVGGIVETVIFQSSDFVTVGAATAREVRDRLRTAQSFDARLSTDGTKVRIFSSSNTNDEIQVTGGTANSVLNFPTDKKFTVKLYKEDATGVISLLDKDGKTAELESIVENFDFDVTPPSDGITALNLAVVVDGKTNIVQQIWLSDSLGATATAEDVVVEINNSASGFIASVASNGTTVRLISNTVNSINSKLNIVENFDEVWIGPDPTYTDETLGFDGTDPDVDIFVSDLDYIYVGRFSERFNSLYIQLSTVSTDPIMATMEYWNGAWTTIGFSDTTNEFQQDGYILFHAPEDWIQSAVDAIETGSSVGYFVRLQRNNVTVATPPTVDRMRVCGANEILQFSTTESVGINKDYTLNRFIGQIELETPLLVNEILTFGTLKTRANLVSASNQTYDLDPNNVLDITIDSVAQTYTFVDGDFSDRNLATAAEVVVAINTNFSGITATVDSGTKVKLEINKWDGIFTVTGGTANTILNFSITEQTSLVAHVAFLESGIIGPYFFETDDFIVAIIDKATTESFLIPLYKESSLTGATSTISVTDTALQTVFPLASDLIGLSFEMIDGDEIGQRKRISNYVPATGVLTLESRTWIAVGALDVTEPYIVMSYDGTNWRKQSIVVPKAFALNGITYGKGWVAVGVADGTDAYILTSNTGFNWLERVNPKNFALNDVAYDGIGLLVTCGDADGTDPYLLSSADEGATWTEETIGSPKNIGMNAVIWDGTATWVMVGNADGTDPYIATSISTSTPMTWIERGPATDDFDLNDITNNGTSLYVAVGNTDGTDPIIFTATDPTSTWTKRNPPNKNINLNGVAWSGTAYATVGDVDGAGPLIYSSTDGITWFVRTVTSPKAFALNKIDWDANNNKFIAVGVADGTDAYMVEGTADGTTWVERANPNNIALNAVARDSSVLSGIPSIGELYQVLPSTVDEVVDFWNIRKVTNISDVAEIKDSSSGTKVQIASISAGGDSAVQVTGGTANDEMVFPTVEQLGVSGYQYWDGLMQLSQWIVDGKQDDQENFPGFKAAGVQIEVLEPVSREVTVAADVTTIEGVTLSSLSDAIKSEISAYVNGLGVGDDVIVSEIIFVIKDVVGVFDVDITSPSVNIAIADDELARVVSANIAIS